MDGFVIRDTHSMVGKLQQRGFSAQQAEGIAEALRDLDSSALATKADLQDLKVDLIKWMVGTHLAYGAIVVGVLVAILQ
jgi:hypothetical protein